MADDCARFIKESIGPTSRYAIGTRAVGEVVGADGYWPADGPAVQPNSVIGVPSGSASRTSR
jgi:hypothetical protein